VNRHPIDLEMQRRHESALRQHGDVDRARALTIERVEAFGAHRQLPEMRLAHASALLANGERAAAVEVLAPFRPTSSCYPPSASSRCGCSA
jgi:hypothetical protein